MARQKAVRTDKGLSALLDGVQFDRLQTLRRFAEFLTQQEMLLGVAEDDRLFSSTVRLAVTDYGVRQAVLGDKLQVSAAAVSRWMSGDSLPPAYVRGKILEALAQVILANVALQDLRSQDVIATGSVSAFVH